jgi:serine/threonine-protein kinase
MKLLNNRYQILDKLGSGGMSEVYRAHDLTLERIVALKILRDDFSNDTTFTDKFHQEAKAAANLSHPNIVTIHDFGLDSGHLYIVMEYVPGKDLKSIIKERGRLPVIECLSLMIQACSGIGAAHRSGLVHCDIKPQNMLVSPEKGVKVTDFGIARALASIQSGEKSDIVWGSPQYFSPEQAAGVAPSPASDVYSLGVVMYESLTGSLPFTGSNPAELAHEHQFLPVPEPRRLNPEIPASLEQIVIKILSKEPSSRYRNANQLGRILVALHKQIFDQGAVSQSDLVNVDVTQSVLEDDRKIPTKYISSIDPSQMKEPIRDNPLDIDWLTWGLGLLALIAIGGLIPLWLWVYLIYNTSR